MVTFSYTDNVTVYMHSAWLIVTAIMFSTRVSVTVAGHN